VKNLTSAITLAVSLACPATLLAQTTTINFDTVPNGAVISNQYTSLGATFKCYDGKGTSACANNNVYAVASASNNSAPNVLGLSASALPLINEQKGYFVVQFTTPVGFVSIDAMAAVVAEFVDTVSAQSNKPFLQVFGPYDAATKKNPLITTVNYSKSTSSLSTGKWGPWETLSLTRPSNDIGLVLFSSGFKTGSTPIYGIFDNLQFAVVKKTLSLTFAGTGAGTITSAPAGISSNSNTSADFPAGATVTLTATPAAAHKKAPILKPSSGPNGKIVKNPKIPTLPIIVSYTFDGWTGAGQNCPATQTTCTVTMDQAKTVGVTFTAHEGPLEIAK
jgi:uncharacterized repeat protein (TIGR02543 family)